MTDLKSKLVQICDHQSQFVLEYIAQRMVARRRWADAATSSVPKQIYALFVPSFAESLDQIDDNWLKQAQGLLLCIPTGMEPLGVLPVDQNCMYKKNFTHRDFALRTLCDYFIQDDVVKVRLDLLLMPR